MTVSRKNRVINAVYMINQIFNLCTIFGRQTVTRRIRYIHHCRSRFDNRFYHTCQIFIVRTPCILGASVVEATATANGTITDLDGNFTLSVPANSTLKITYIGYKPVTVKSAAIVNVLLEEDTQMVDEVVVTGYTTQRKADLTGAVSVVKVDEIQKQGENNPVKALQGRVPGMNITADGNPSGSATVRIRGIGTLNNNDPLYIIDGVPTKAGMHELNGNDIESIQVLKDAASASIYGSRAANGVIVIRSEEHTSELQSH